MALDPRTPVIVGVGQTQRRPESLEGIPEPAEMMSDALRLAADDARGGSKLLEAADSIRVVELLSWRYANPGTLLAERLGASPRETMRTGTGGNSPQMLVNRTAADIQRGDLDVVLIAGAEAMYTRFMARKTKDWLDWTTQPAETPEPIQVGDDRPGTNEGEMARSVAIPTQIYPVFENAIRAAAGESIDEHQVKVSELWARFSDVAAENPNAWTRTPKSAEEIRTVTPDNRLISLPYTKLMNSNLQVDQAAALILCSVDAAQRLGVPEDRWVFPHSGADAHDHWWVSERDDLASSPAIATCGREALGLAGIGIDDVGHVDLYSCFPSAVQVSAAELGLGLDRQLTVTGGLCFAGGPGNNYVTHSIAAMADVLRNDPGAFGLVTAVGWYITKHGVGIYSTKPPENGFRASNPQSEIDASPKREQATDYEGPATVESYTVMYERDGSPALGIVACLLDDGRRTWGNVRDSDGLQQMVSTDPIGAKATLASDGSLQIS